LVRVHEVTATRLLGQYAGAFLGAAVVFGAYYEKLVGFEAGGSFSMATAGIFATYPSPDISQLTGFMDQILGTGLLLFCVRGITDDRNAKVPAYLQPFLIGLIVINIGISFGFNCGYAINPARDLSPRLFTLVAGWGHHTFTDPDYSCWFYVPIVATHIGAIIGCFLYDVVIGWHLTNEDEAEDEASSTTKDIENVAAAQN